MNLNESELQRARTRYLGHGHVSPTARSYVRSALASIRHDKPNSRRAPSAPPSELAEAPWKRSSYMSARIPRLRAVQVRECVRVLERWAGGREAGACVRCTQQIA